MSSITFTKADLIAGKEIPIWENSSNKMSNWLKMDFDPNFTATDIPIAFYTPSDMNKAMGLDSDYRLNSLLLNGAINDIRVEYEDNDKCVLYGVPRLTDRMKIFLDDAIEDDANMLFRLCSLSANVQGGNMVQNIISFVITMC